MELEWKLGLKEGMGQNRGDHGTCPTSRQDTTPLHQVQSRSHSGVQSAPLVIPLTCDWDTTSVSLVGVWVGRSSCLSFQSLRRRAPQDLVSSCPMYCPFPMSYQLLSTLSPSPPSRGLKVCLGTVQLRKLRFGWGRRRTISLVSESTARARHCRPPANYLHLT